MLLRSSSTPVISSVLSSFSDSPNKDFDTTKLSFSHSMHHHLHLKSLSSCNSPATSLSDSGLKGFRRAQSDSNLEGTAAEEFLDLHKQNNCFSKPHRSMLRSEPSFCIYSADADEECDVRPEDNERGLKRTVTIGDCIEALGSGGFSFNKRHVVLVEEVKEEEEDVLNGRQRLSVESEIRQTSRSPSPPLYLATGLGIDDADFIGGGGGDNSESNVLNFNDEADAEEYYKKMLDEYPCHPLLLRNYAQLLQSNGNLHEAEEYYYCATLADPDDGETLSQYAKLIWELHRDKEKACSYFNQAVQVAPQDNNVLAAYASFLWEIDDDDEEEEEEEDRTAREYIQIKDKAHLNHRDNEAGFRIGGGANIAAAGANRQEDIEGYYRRMIEENPCNSLVLKNYARFLYESKGDLEGAQEYYSRAVIADPHDGEAKSRYAILVWELHRDHKKALSYFEQAVESGPENINVLAAYTSFLWETEENEEEGDSSSSTRPNPLQMPVFEQGALTRANRELEHEPILPNHS